jgi:hypothetical protein
MKESKQVNTDEIAVVNTETIKDAEVYVYIYIKPDTSPEIVNPYVQRITDVDGNNHVVVAWVSVKNLESLASLPAVKKVASVIPPVVNTGSITSEGDAIHRTNLVRSNYSQLGAGVKVGIMSDGVDNYASSQATGDLPPIDSGLTVLSNTLGGDEGTAMLEIVHDMAPSAKLYFHDCGANTVAFNSAIDSLVSAGCKVICDDISWIADPFFEDGPVASHVASVISTNNVVYISSAGNRGGSHYQGDFYPQPSGSTNHDFSHGTTTTRNLYLNMPVGGTVTVILEWNDQFGASGNDYDLYLYDGSGTQVAYSWYTQDGTQDPIEGFSYTATTAGIHQIVVDKYLGSDKTLEVFIYTGNGTSVYTNNITPVDAVFGHPAVPGAIAVGAVRVTTPDRIEYFSSQGPSTICFPSLEIRNKPDVVGSDGGLITGAGSFGSWDGSNWRFYGTSAAAPHVAGIVAQMWGAYPAKSNVEIRDAVKSSAVDLGDAGFDYVFGNGRADAMNSYGALPVEITSFDALKDNDKIKLDWTTATEVNNYGFEVERASTGSAPDWEKIGFVQGHGNSNSPKKYTFFDENPPAGNLQYRIKQIDVDGYSKYYVKIAEINLNVTAVKENQVPKEFSLLQNYPNPFNPFTIINYQLPTGSFVTLKVYDVLGNEIATLVNEEKAAGEYKVNFNSSNLASGMYIYKLNAGGKTFIKKMILMR